MRAIKDFTRDLWPVWAFLLYLLLLASPMFMKLIIAAAALFLLWLIGAILFAAYGDWQVVKQRKQDFKRLRD